MNTKLPELKQNNGRGSQKWPKNENIKCGYHLVEPEIDQITLLEAKGYDMIAFSVDIRMLDIGARLPFIK